MVRSRSNPSTPKTIKTPPRLGFPITPPFLNYIMDVDLSEGRGSWSYGRERNRRETVSAWMEGLCGEGRSADIYIMLSSLAATGIGMNVCITFFLSFSCMSISVLYHYSIGGWIGSSCFELNRTMIGWGFFFFRWIDRLRTLYICSFITWLNSCSSHTVPFSVLVQSTSDIDQILIDYAKFSV